MKKHCSPWTILGTIPGLMAAKTDHHMGRAVYMYFQQLGADAELPQSNSGDILAGLAQDESAASVRTNSREWSSDWSTAHSAYNMTYNGMCYSY